LLLQKLLWNWATPLRTTSSTIEMEIRTASIRRRNTLTIKNLEHMNSDSRRQRPEIGILPRGRPPLKSSRRSRRLSTLHPMVEVYDIHTQSKTTKRRNNQSRCLPLDA